MAQITPPDTDAVHLWWTHTSRALGMADVNTPGAYAFGGTTEQADQLVELVLSGTKTATSSALWSIEDADETVPVVGDLSIICDGAGHPRALIRLTDVVVTSLSDVDERHALAEGEGDRSLRGWRSAHEEFFSERLPAGREVSDTMPVVLEYFELLAS